jgi:mannose-6-phosphate isomerase
MMKNDLRIEILGTSLSIAANEDPDYLQDILSQYTQWVEYTQKATGLQDPLKTAVLAGFLLCDELEKTKKQLAHELTAEKTSVMPGDEEAERLTLSLISRLDDIMLASNKGDKAGLQHREPFYRLKKAVKKYDWGSPEWIPELLGLPNPEHEPWAEVWMGVHPGGPSLAEIPGENGAETPLSELIHTDPVFFLGNETNERFGALPFLFKLLAAGKPLSIQAHPNQEQAREGWARENAAGLAPDAPNRNYRDPNHKPEILCALTPFKAMAGFRAIGEIQALLALLAEEAAVTEAKTIKRLISALEEDEGLKAFLQTLFGLDAEKRAALSAFIIEAEDRLKENYPGEAEPWELCAQFARMYPGDPGMLSPLYLNVLDLAPGEAIFLPAGILHAYVYGLGVELMANSDNVLRGGLTPKHVDLNELVRVLRFMPFKPEILAGEENNPHCLNYPVECSEFSLQVMNLGRDEQAFPQNGPLIVLASSGKAVLRRGETCLELAQGEAAFIPAGVSREELTVSGEGMAHIAGPGTLRSAPPMRRAPPMRSTGTPLS